MKTTPITINIDTKVLKQFQNRIDELTEEGETFQEWLEMEFNHNGEALLEMLLGDF